MGQPEGPPPGGSGRERDRWEGEMFRLLVENVKNYAIFVVDPEGRVITWSKGAERLLGYTEEEIVGRPFAAFFTATDRERGEVEREMRDALRAGRGEDDRWHVRKDGSSFWCSGVLTPLTGPDGSHRGFAKIMRDLTEQKRHEEYRDAAEAALRERARLLELANVFARRLDGTIVFWNLGCEEMYGYSKDEAVDAVSHDLLRTRFPAPLERVQAALLSDGRWQGELVHTRRDGREITVACRWMLYTDHAEGLVVEVNTDITALKEVQVELERANRNKDEFLAMLGHELRNPLAPILNAISLLNRQGVDEEMQQHARNMIERQARHMTRLVDDLLEVSRISKGKIVLKQGLIDLAPVVLRAVDAIRPRVEARWQHLSVSIHDEPIWLRADPARIEQILTNLLTNASKYTGGGGHIWLTTGREGDEAVIRVRDTGAGIEPEVLPRIFDMFAQHSRTIERSEGGLGVGLTLVKRLTELHGGRVEAASAGVGQGSEFTVRLPIPEASASAGPQRARIEGQAPAPEGSGLRVIVVDDNTDAADSLRMLLQLSGHDVIIAHTGPTALQQAASWRPDVILLDIGLPGLDGYEVARRLRQDPAMQGVSLAAMTGYGQESDRQRSEQAGFDEHMVKPVDPLQLERFLTGVANRRGTAPSSRPGPPARPA